MRVSTGWYIMGVDLGQVADYTAISILEIFKNEKKEGYKREFDLRHLERPELGTSYPKIIERVNELLYRPPLLGNSFLVVDQTGVGRAVVDMFIAAGVKPIPITITGGTTVSFNVNEYHVPKRDLIVTLQVTFQDGRLKIAKGLTLRDIFKQELKDFRIKINLATAHDSYGAWREGQHDDIVLSVALACWLGNNEDVWRNIEAPEDKYIPPEMPEWME